ncbi:MAG: zinc ABC transporter substrate-binding protein [Planctomycetota bacterium]
MISTKDDARCLLGCLLLGILILPGCGGQPKGHGHGETQPKKIERFQGEYPIKVTVTVGMVADLVREIGGDYVEVTQLMGTGVDPHLYTATRDDSAAILRADLVLYNGLLLEGKMSEILGGGKTPSKAVAESLPKSMLTQDPEMEGHPDPHVWMDVSLWARVADGVTDTLIAFDPEHSWEFQENGKRVSYRLNALDSWGRELMQTIPEQRRVLVTSHDAFRYFGSAYGLEVQAVQGISTDSEAGLHRINELVDMLAERKIAAVFVESSVPKESIESLVEGTKRKGHEIKIGGSLFSDAMGAEGTYEGTYVGMMEHNLSTIAKALGGEVPEDGFEYGRAMSESESAGE